MYIKKKRKKKEKRKRKQITATRLCSFTILSITQNFATEHIISRKNKQ